jgi:hypothetical protein
MSFKTFNCAVDSFGINSVPSEGWNVDGDSIIINTAGNTITGYFVCDPRYSGFPGANNVQPGMTSEDFNTLWPLMVLLLLTGFCVKKVRHVFGR